MQAAMDMKHLSRAEKLMMMEALWEDLSKNDECLESPSWHERELLETAINLGQTPILPGERLLFMSTLSHL